MEKNFRITITKTEPNPEYAREMEEREKSPSWYVGGMDKTYPAREITTDILITEITPAQFEAIRKAVLEVF